MINNKITTCHLFKNNITYFRYYIMNLWLLLLYRYIIHNYCNNNTYVVVVASRCVGARGRGLYTSFNAKLINFNFLIFFPSVFFTFYNMISRRTSVLWFILILQCVLIRRPIWFMAPSLFIDYVYTYTRTRNGKPIYTTASATAETICPPPSRVVFSFHV